MTFTDQEIQAVVLTLKNTWNCGDIPGDKLIEHYGSIHVANVYENAIYTAADRQLEGYAGGVWTIREYELCGHGLLVWFPPAKGAKTLTLDAVDNFAGSLEVSIEAAGWALSTLTANRVLWALYHRWQEQGEPESGEKIVELMRDQFERLNSGWPEALTDERDTAAVWKFLD